MTDLSFENDLREKLAQRLASDELELPVLPDTATHVLELYRKDECDARELARVIQRDQAMSGRVLRVANSAAYAPNEEIVSLQQAVGRLGFDTVCDIAFSVALRAKAFAVPGHEARIRAMWVHSATAAAWAGEIARSCRANVEGAFMAGLLHDAGKPVVLVQIVDLLGGRAAIEQSRLVHALVREFHEEVGLRLVRGWSLPEWLAEAVGHHHRPEEARDFVDLARITCLADLFAHWSIQPSEEHELVLQEHPVLKAMGIYADELDALYALRDKVHRISEAFT